MQGQLMRRSVAWLMPLVLAVLSVPAMAASVASHGPQTVTQTYTDNRFATRVWHTTSAGASRDQGFVVFTDRTTGKEVWVRGQVTVEEE